MYADIILKIIKAHPEGIWIRNIAKKAKISPATVCNHIYGYFDLKGNFHPPTIQDEIIIEQLGDGALTIIRPK